MKFGRLLSAIGAGIAAFLIVGVVVTELAAPAIEFSLFLGLPAGLAAGLATAAFVFVRLADPDPMRRRPALALASFGSVFLLVLIVAAGGLGVRNTVALLAGGLLGLLAAIVVWYRT